jgi:trk/ktr system potassium uptake protein
MTQQPARSTIRIAVAGAGNVGRHVSKDLVQRGHEVVLIEQDSNVADAYRDEIDVNWIVGDACELHVLDSAVLSSCEVIVATTGDDEDNLVISLLAKQEFAVPRVIARVNHPDNQWLFTETWGIDVAVSTPQVLASLVEEAVSVGDLVRLMIFEQGRAALVEVTLAEESPACAKTVGELQMPPDCALVAIVRDRHVMSPQADTPLEAGDEVMALASPEAEDDIRRALAG